MEELTPFYSLGLALALGLLIGLERGWKERHLDEGRRVAGIRTFALIGLLGGVWGLLAQEVGQAVLAVAFGALALVLVAAHVMAQIRDQDMGITGEIASLLTFAFGALAALGYPALAAAGAVVTATLLGIKPVLHAWVNRLEERELFAAFQLLLISVVILPLLPNQGYGPWEALNPYRIWWMVVLIAAISFVGYFSMKIIGERKGILLTGLMAGLASSTAVTVNFARIARKTQGSSNVLAAGILVACATMFPRMLVVSSLFSWDLARQLLFPVLAMMTLSYALAALCWKLSSPAAHEESPGLTNPFELKPALIFAALLAGIILLSQGLSEHFGDAGIYTLAAVSGLADVDAITLSLADMTDGQLSLEAATLGILIAAFVNSLVKGALAMGIGGWALGYRVAGTLSLSVGAGLLTWWLQY
ncbi:MULTISPECIES: MgtC/SapB family protein [unclassified Ectothiorhodospira]|uniref:MgtC/SapB family protein n=1 Tax=unclassified Ectothiorhodospira TaxID=2684909 RepID=UPI001EE7979E|nr:MULTISPECIES: MgtC/SapB family protein [unclassified Ectothiorhodospira]MCG5515586.1 MgtC/SapB family protein [Ectothiorhodospira sp. 9100]MCG5520109.1 MgtC/SapB family protein [Ectothiorhodospira sp. 9905]